MLSVGVFNLIKQWAMTNIVTSTLILGVAVFGLVRWLLTARKNYPPGPMGLPYFGYVPLMGKAPYRLLLNLSKKYGKVFSVNLGGRPTIVLNDFSSVKEAFSNPALFRRPTNTVFDILFNPGGSVPPDGQEWVKIRRFTLHTFRDLGLGKARLEELMKEEVIYFLQEVSDTNGKPVYARIHLLPSVANNVSALLFGKHFPRGHVGLVPFSQPFPPTRLICMCGYIMFIPFAKQIFRVISAVSPSKLFQVFRAFRKHVRDEILLHKQNASEGVSSHDFIDEFLTEMESIKDDETNEAFTDVNLKDTVQLLLGAGSNTVATTLEWACLLMAVNPEVQKKVQHEIDEIIGKEIIPCWADHARLPYTQAVLMEVQRWVTLIPINLLRIATEDVTLQGYDIPKGTIVLANLWAVHHDPEMWDEPEKFKPERFLSSDGKTIIKPENYIPFSYGKRSCLGEPLAIQEMFLYFSAIMQKFTTKMPPGCQADLEGVLSIALEPPKQDICFVRRDSKNSDMSN